MSVQFFGYKSENNFILFSALVHNDSNKEGDSMDLDIARQEIDQIDDLKSFNF